MATPLMSSLSLKPPFTIEKTTVKSLPSLARPSSLKIQASGVKKKIKTDTPYGPGGGLKLKEGKDASGRSAKGKGLPICRQISPIYNPDEWSPSGDTYTGGTTGLLIWAVTLAGILGGGALLVYNTSALGS